MSNKELTGWQRFLKSMTKAHDIATEEDIMTDHDYDGIKELDNVLPPWWKYGFYITIAIGIFYYVQVFTNSEKYSQTEEFAAEVEKGKQEVEAYKKANPELFKTDVKLLTDAASLEAGKKVFNTYCVACHMADGGGGIGPNLTDDKWILGGGIENVFQTIAEGGRPGKGMVSWKSSINLEARQQVASYVISLQGTTPANPKAAEGDITWSKQ
ncbi:MAG: c-type cytochrome [Flavobacteriaceae bacterium]|nr:c-type cytochrome [Flavobacteriaceae bacterium]